jgi:signal peptidase I
MDNTSTPSRLIAPPIGRKQVTPSAGMAVFRRFSPSLISGFRVVAMIALWLTFAPTQAGGRASYIIVVGNSMEPGFHIGDLVIVHEETRYQAGDAVVYNNLELGNYVFHRILKEKLGRFTLKGDNNSWTDTYQPSQEEVIGKLWMRVPKGGFIVQQIRKPYVMAGIAGALGLILARGILANHSKGRKRMNNDRFASIKQKLNGWLASRDENEKLVQPSSGGKLLEGSFFALGLVAFASLVLGIVAFSRPATRIVNDEITYDQLGIFAYSASAPQGVYDSNAVKSGDPVFPKLTCSVDVAFQYALIAPGAENVSGSHQMTATISEPLSGWQRVVELQEVATFNGNNVGTSTRLDLCEMERLTQAMEQITEFHPGSYILTVSPNVSVKGSVSGRVLDATFNPALTFKYDRVHFYLLEDEEETADVLNRTERGILGGERTEANTMRLLGAELAIPALRLFSVLGAAIALGGMAFLGLRLQSLLKNDPIRFIGARFESQMIEVRDAGSIHSRVAVDVSSIDDLGKLAERFNTMILHAQTDNVHVYFVQGDGTLYRFVINPQETGSAVPMEEAESRS